MPTLTDTTQKIMSELLSLEVIRIPGFLQYLHYVLYNVHYNPSIRTNMYPEPLSPVRSSCKQQNQ